MLDKLIGVSGLRPKNRENLCFAPGGHSCKIGNVPIVEAKNIFFMFPVFWWYFLYQFVFTKMEKVKGQLKNISGEFFGQDLRFLCPHVTLPLLSFFFILRAWFVVKCPYMSPLNICCVLALKKMIFQWFSVKKSSYWLKRHLVTFSQNITFKAAIFFCNCW